MSTTTAFIMATFIIKVIITFILAVVELIEVVFRQQVLFNVVHGFVQRFNKFVEVLFVQKNLVTVVSVVAELFLAFGKGNVVVVRLGCPYIKEISSPSTSTYCF